MVARAGIEPATFRFSGGRSYQLSYLAGRPSASRPKCLAVMATLTGLEPATSAVTGRRANQLRHRALLSSMLRVAALRTPNGIRTRATAVKGRRPRPLDDGGLIRISPGYSSTSFVGSFDSLGYRCPNLQTRWSQHQFQSSCTLSSRAPIAQLVELRTFNPQVVGSSPTGGTKHPPQGGSTVRFTRSARSRSRRPAEQSRR